MRHRSLVSMAAVAVVTLSFLDQSALLRSQTPPALALTGQVTDDIVGGPLSGLMPALSAPFSADAITTVSHAFPNGTRLAQSTTARYYRDSAGRVRVELLMEGLRAPKTLSERHIRLTVFPMTIVDPPAPVSAGYTLDPVTRTVRHTGRSRPLSTGGRGHMGVPIGGVHFVTFHGALDWLRENDPRILGEDAVQQESLGSRVIAGVETIGKRVTATFPAGYFGDNATVTLVDEQWESLELGLVIYARYADSRSGFIEYRLTNIRRAEPSPDLFMVPSDYTLQTPAGSMDDPVWGSMGPERYSVEVAAGRLQP